MFTNVGEDLTTDLWDGTISAPANWYIGSGTGAVAAAKGDTTLGVEVESRVAAVDSQPVSNQNRHVSTITYTGALTITEAGLFDAATVGNMPVREVFAGIGVNASDKIEFTFDIDTA